MLKMMNAVKVSRLPLMFAITILFYQISTTYSIVLSKAKQTQKFVCRNRSESFFQHMEKIKIKNVSPALFVQDMEKVK